MYFIIITIINICIMFLVCCCYFTDYLLFVILFQMPPKIKPPKRSHEGLQKYQQRMEAEASTATAAAVRNDGLQIYQQRAEAGTSSAAATAVRAHDGLQKYQQRVETGASAAAAAAVREPYDEPSDSKNIYIYNMHYLLNCLLKGMLHLIKLVII